MSQTSKLKEIQSQIESLNQNIICIIQQQQVEKDKQIQEQQKNQDESKKFNLNLNTFQQQITKNNSDQKNIFDEKLKNIDTRLSQYEKKVSDLEERIYKCLKQQNQKISKLEETNEVLKKEISVQNSLSVKTFQTQLGEVKQNLQDQINTLRQNQLQEQEYKNMSIDFTTIIDQWKEYKNKINTDQEKIQVQQQSQDQKLEKIAEMLNIQIIENKNQITELNKDNADLKSQIDILKQNYSLKTELEDLQKKSQDDKVKLLESQVQILLLQNQLAQAIMPVNQVKALIDYFRDKKNLNEFLRKIRKNLQD
ncbi:unnamed protein product (macronuclear) [Paramecium tetraurelia]|uniref:GRIP domain-containing protein n=1 Tax=Paramecium tetraurelia TaxID=5888 RepID=A0CHW2_PARTE|nr:uncharacterized protein GSPATT00038481001 [Paramecium tetraurelia]CAK70379.1 unnamed protein product [Paramecium tetraurelia]|eukprot:XP_001437776.1 hypothetical protein (macronuclear) [Paramecium tetraurelia strain d4-2]